MECHVCEKQGAHEEAVTICIVCGMGLCSEHAFKQDILLGHHRFGILRGKDRLSEQSVLMHLPRM